jgi:hypothetical protein
LGLRQAVVAAFETRGRVHRAHAAELKLVAARLETDRERITLQGSLAYLLLLTGLSFVSAFPSATATLAGWAGFSLPSNFLFAVALAALAVLHVTALVTLSRVELRSIALTQELALVKEQLDRVARESKSNTSASS